MKLPHKKPLIFLNKLIESKKYEVITSIEIKENLSIALCIEASAQSFTYFINDDKKYEFGVLAGVKNCEFFGENREYSNLTNKLLIKNRLNPFYIVEFYVYDNQKFLIAKGELTLKLITKG